MLYHITFLNCFKDCGSESFLTTGFGGMYVISEPGVTFHKYHEGRDYALSSEFYALNTKFVADVIHNCCTLYYFSRAEYKTLIGQINVRSLGSVSELRAHYPI